MSEQLVLEDVLRERGAVECEERPFRPIALGVDRSRDQLLSRAGLSEDQHACRGGSNCLDDLVNRAHFFRLASELAVMRQSLELRRQLAIFLLDVELVERLGNERFESIELVGSERLLDVIVRAFTHCLHCRINRCLPGDDYALGWNRAVLQLLQQRQPVHLRHLEVGEHHAERFGAELVESLLTINCNCNLVSLIAQYRAQPFRDGTVVVRNEYLGVLGLSLWNGSFLLVRWLI